MLEECERDEQKMRAEAEYKNWLHMSYKKNKYGLIPLEKFNPKKAEEIKKE